MTTYKTAFILRKLILKDCYLTKSKASKRLTAFLKILYVKKQLPCITVVKYFQFSNHEGISAIYKNHN